MGMEKAFLSPLMITATGTDVSDKELKGMTKDNKKAARRAIAQNNCKTICKDVVTIAGGAAAAAGVTKAVASSKVLQKAITSAAALFKTCIKDFTKISIVEKALPFVTKAAGFLKALPGPAKIAGVVIAIITLGLLKINHDKKNFNNGKVVQEGIDKSKLENIL